MMAREQEGFSPCSWCKPQVLLVLLHPGQSQRYNEVSAALGLCRGMEGRRKVAVCSAHHRLNAEGRVHGRLPLGAELKNTL